MTSLPFPPTCWEYRCLFHDFYSAVILPQVFILEHTKRGRGGWNSTFVSVIPYEPTALTVESAKPRLGNTFSTLSWIISPSVKDTLPITHETTMTMIMMLGIRKDNAVPNATTVVREALVTSQHVLPTGGQTKSPRKQSKRPLRLQEKQISTRQKCRPS